MDSKFFPSLRMSAVIRKKGSGNGALLAAAPPLVIYAFLMDYYIGGLTAGATKG